jgi:hypothetical protein
MSNRQRQWLVVAGLFVAVAGVLWWQAQSSEVAAPGSTRAPAPRPETDGTTQAHAGTGDAGRVPEVRLSVLAQPQPEPIDTGRDPFRFSVRPAAPARPPAAGAGVVPRPAGGSGSPEGPGEIEPPRIALRFIGILRLSESGRQLAVLTDGRGIYYGAEGDVIEGQYRILRISGEAVEVSYVDGRGRQRIPLAGGA